MSDINKFYCNLSSCAQRMGQGSLPPMSLSRSMDLWCPRIRRQCIHISVRNYRYYSCL